MDIQQISNKTRNVVLEACQNLKKISLEKIDRFTWDAKSDLEISNRVVVLFVIVLAICSLYGLKTSSVHIGHDFWYHIQRIEALYYQLREGIVYFPINYYFFGGYGYASSTGYPDIFLIMPAVFRIFLPSPKAYNLFLLLISLSSIFISYFSAKTIFGKKSAALLFCILYSFSLYKFCCIYTRSAIGEVLGIIFLPIAFAGLINLLYQKFDKPYLLVTGLVLLCYSHTISAYLFVVTSIIICLFHPKVLITNWKKIAKCASITIGLDAFFVFPCVELYLSQDLKVHQPWADITKNAIMLGDLFSVKYWIGTYHIVLLNMLAICLLFLIPLNEILRNSILKLSIAGSMISIFAVTDLFPWTKHVLMNSIQFPWRLLGISYFFSSTVIATEIYLISKITRAKRLILFSLVAFLVTGFFFSWNQIKTAPNSQTYNLTDWKYEGWRLEFTPVGIRRDGFKKFGRHCYTEEFKEFPCYIDNQHHLIRFDSPLNYVKSIDVPFVFYKGYVAKTNEGKVVPITVSPDGFCRINLSQLEKGTRITVSYEGTAIQKVSKGVTLLTIILLIALRLKKRLFSCLTGRRTQGSSVRTNASGRANPIKVYRERRKSLTRL